MLRLGERYALLRRDGGHLVPQPPICGDSAAQENAPRPEATNGAGPGSLTGGRGLLQDEPLVFELGGWDKTGVDLPEIDDDADDLAGLTRDGLDDPGAVRARGRAPLRAPQPEEPRDRPRRSTRSARAP